MSSSPSSSLSWNLPSRRFTKSANIHFCPPPPLHLPSSSCPSSSSLPPPLPPHLHSLPTVMPISTGVVASVVAKRSLRFKFEFGAFCLWRSAASVAFPLGQVEQCGIEDLVDGVEIVHLGGQGWVDRGRLDLCFWRCHCLNWTHQFLRSSCVALPPFCRRNGLSPASVHYTVYHGHRTSAENGTEFWPH